jgi:hypothetical protein
LRFVVRRYVEGAGDVAKLLSQGLDHECAAVDVLGVELVVRDRDDEYVVQEFCEVRCAMFGEIRCVVRSCEEEDAADGGY